jgi:hypothetical protein
MAKAERSKRDSVAAQIEVFRSAGVKIDPPVPLNDREQSYFDGILTDREHSSWSPNHVVIAANLAKTYAAIDQLWIDLNDRGFTLINEKGTPVANPSVSALSQMTSAMQALNRTLGLSASQRGLAGSKQAARNQTAREADELNAKVAAEVLLA